MTRFRILAAAIVVFVLVWTALWVGGAWFARQQLANLANADGVTEPRIACARFDVGGFPFRFDFTCTDLSVDQADLSVGIAQVRLSVLVYKPTHLLAYADGPARITDAFSGAERRLDWQQAAASLRLSGWRLARFSAEAENVAFVDSLLTDRELARLTTLEIHAVDRPAPSPTDPARTALDLFARSTGIAAPELAIAEATLTLEANLSAFPADVRKLMAPDLLPAWQQAGGQVHLSRFEAADTTTGFELTGTVGLDASGYPDGALVLVSTGLAERLAAHVAEPQLTLILGGQDDQGAHRQTFTLKGGMALAGPLPVGFVPALF